MEKTSTFSRHASQKKLLFSFILLGLFISQFALAHDVIAYSAGCSTGPIYKVDATVANVNFYSNYAWQYKNASGNWVCIVNGNNTINGYTYSISGASSTTTINPDPIVFNNPNIGLQGLVIRCIISDGIGVNPCNMPFNNTYNTGSNSNNFTLAVNNTPCASTNVLQLGNRVWYDVNNNGINTNEDGIANVTVHLYKDDDNNNIPDGSFIATDITDIDGYYSFTSLVPGNYIVGVVTPAGYVKSTVNGGDPDNNIDLDNNGVLTVDNETRGYTITLAVGTEPNGNINNTYDFGFLPDCNCTTSSNNLLVNGSFEDGNTGWLAAGGTLTTGTGYVACGVKNGFNNWSSGTSYVYQDVAAIPGATYTFKGFSGTHTGGLNCSPKLIMTFRNSAGANIGYYEVAVTRDVDVNHNQLEQYTVTGTAPAGTVTVRVHGAINCNVLKMDAFCLTSSCTTPATPVATVTQPTCSVATGTVVLTNLPSGSWTINGTNNGVPFTFTGSGTSYTQSNVNAGTYIYTVTNAGGCTSASVTTVVNSQPATPATPTATITQPTCSVATGSVVLSGLPSGNWVVTKNPGNTTITGSGSSVTINTLTAGTYTFTVTNASGCTSAAATVIINAQPATPATPTATITQPTCSVATGSVVLSGLPSGNWTLTQNPGNTTITGTGTTTTISGLAPATYTYTVTNASGCTSAAATVVINTPPATPATPTATPVQPTCSVATGSVVLSGLPSGNWIVTKNPGNTTFTGSGSSVTINTLTTGTYTFTVTNASGCTSAAATVVINAQPATPVAPTATITQPTCTLSTGSITLSGLPSGNWTLNQSRNGTITTITGTGTTTTISGLTPATYTYTVTNASGCTSPATSNLVVNTQPTPPAAPTATVTQTICNATTGIILLSGLPASGNWTLTRNPGNVTTTGSGTSTVVSGLAADTYTFTVTNSNGCVSPVTTVTLASQSASSSLGGFVWIDVNKNGVDDDGSLALAGVLVSLYYDANADNVVDGAAIRAVTTTSTGRYSFTGLCPGNYIVGFGTVNGYVRTIQLNLVNGDAGDSDPSQVTGLTRSINLIDKQADFTNDAGYYPSTILPVSFGNITAQARNCEVNLLFEVLTQQNTKQFEIEYSKDGGNSWANVGIISAKASNGTAYNYSFTHTQPAIGVNLYRIKSVDADRRVTYSNVVSATSSCSGKGQITAYPNPAFEMLNVSLPAAYQDAQVQLFNSMGQMVISDVRKSGLVRSLNTQNLTPGIYLLKVVYNSNVVLTQKVVKGE